MPEATAMQILVWRRKKSGVCAMCMFDEPMSIVCRRVESRQKTVTPTADREIMPVMRLLHTGRLVWLRLSLRDYRTGTYLSPESHGIGIRIKTAHAPYLPLSMSYLS